MAWYEVQEEDEVVHVRASNTRTAIDKGFRRLCGMKFNLLPGVKMTLHCMRLRGGSEKVRILEQFYQRTRPQTRRDRETELIAKQQLKQGEI